METTTATQTGDTAMLTTNDLDAMTNDDRWLGFGYLGERNNAREAIRTGEHQQTTADRLERTIADTDRHVLDVANARGWDYDRLFTWANSKNGRWFADITIGSLTTPENEPHADPLLR